MKTSTSLKTINCIFCSDRKSAYNRSDIAEL
jgi:hypothetical protein